MPISTLNQAQLAEELGVYMEQAPILRSIMIPVGVAGEAAKRTEVLVVVGAVIDALFGQAAPTILP
jgi:hypothetical protein